MRREIIIDSCKDVCEKSMMQFRHGAIIVYRNKIAAQAYNVVKPDLRCFPFRSIHAEVHVVQKFLEKYSKEELRRATLFVVRINREGELMNSKPCRACSHYLCKHKVRKVVYSTPDASDDSASDAGSDCSIDWWHDTIHTQYNEIIKDDKIYWV